MNNRYMPRNICITTHDAISAITALGMVVKNYKDTDPEFANHMLEALQSIRTIERSQRKLEDRKRYREYREWRKTASPGQIKYARQDYLKHMEFQHSLNELWKQGRAQQANAICEWQD